MALAGAPGAAALPATPDAPGYTVNGTVRAIVRLGDVIYFGGSFTTVNGLPRTNLAAVSAVDGSVLPWAPTTDNLVWSLAASGSTIYVGGDFANVGDTGGNQARDGLAAFDAAGKVLPWDPDAGAGGRVFAMTLRGSRMYVGGSFAGVGGLIEANLGVVDSVTGAGVGWSTNPPAPNNDVLALDLSPDGSTLYVGGTFGQIGQPGPLNRLGVAAVDAATGAVDPAWDPSDPTNGGFIDDISVGPTGTVYLVGDFFPNLLPTDPSMGFAPRYYAAELQPAGNGATGAATPFVPDADSEALAIQPAADGVYLGGTFSNLNKTRVQQPRNALGFTDLATGLVQGWDPSPNGNVIALVVAADGSLYVGGSFTSMATGTASGFASFSPPPASTASPEIQGTPLPGETLTCTQGSWTGAQPRSYQTQILYDGAPQGAPATSYVVQAGDVGHTVGCSVTAHNRTADVAAASSPVTIQAPPSAPVVLPPPGLPAPVYRKTANAYPQSGVVLIKTPGATRFVRLTGPTQIPLGSVVDATRGVVRICTATAKGVVQCADFYAGRFRLRQVAGSITELVLTGGNFKVCRTRKARTGAAHSAKKPTVVRKLWGSGKGNFRTVGRYASATIRGTKWLTADRCDGTQIRVAIGSVTVRDFVKRKALRLRAPRSYLARARKRRA